MTDEKRTEILSALVDGELPEAHASRATDTLLGDPDLRDRWARYHLIGAAIRGRARVPLAGDGTQGAAGAQPLPVPPGAALNGAQTLADRVRDAVAAEPVVLGAGLRFARGGRSLRVAAVGAAIAASVAVAAVVGLQSASVSPAVPSADMTARAPAEGPVAPVLPVPPATASAGVRPAIGSVAQQPSTDPATGPRPALSAAVETSPAGGVTLRARSTDSAGAGLAASTDSRTVRSDAEDVALTRMEWARVGPRVQTRLDAFLVNHNEQRSTSTRVMSPYARLVTNRGPAR